MSDRKRYWSEFPSDIFPDPPESELAHANENMIQPAYFFRSREDAEGCLRILKDTLQYSQLVKNAWVQKVTLSATGEVRYYIVKKKEEE
ncbi:MAG: hypothetical protein U9Q76_08530 [candidate division WOR-3 bacterium]|nr:hypothetical protein [candidate division WOR-3 bacterium]